MSFRLQADVSSSGNNYFLYYGASQVAPVLQDTSQVYLLWDDFSLPGARFWNTWLDSKVVIANSLAV
jgi:hypothetical protein